MSNILSLLLFLILASCGSSAEQPSTSLYNYDVEKRIQELGIVLEKPIVPKGIKIELASRSGNLIYLSGNGPIASNGDRTVGKVGSDLSIEEGYQAARLTAINHLAVLKDEIGDLNKVVQVIKVLGMVNTPAEFSEHPAVINGYSDLLVEVFGERGQHARSAVGMASLPWNLACEVEAIVQIADK